MYLTTLIVLVVTMELLEIFKDIQIEVEGSSQFGRYKYPMIIQLKKDRPELTVQDLEEYVNNLKERYPNRSFYLRKTYTSGADYYVITQRTFVNDNRVKGRISIYFNLDKQTFHVPKSYVKGRHKLANFLIMTTLGKLGVSQTKSAKKTQTTEEGG